MRSPRGAEAGAPSDEPVHARVLRAIPTANLILLNIVAFTIYTLVAQHAQVQFPRLT